MIFLYASLNAIGETCCKVHCKTVSPQMLDLETVQSLFRL